MYLQMKKQPIKLNLNFLNGLIILKLKLSHQFNNLNHFNSVQIIKYFSHFLKANLN